MSNVETVQASYQAFGHGDIPAVLDKLDNAVERAAAVPRHVGDGWGGILARQPHDFQGHGAAHSRRLV